MQIDPVVFFAALMVAVVAGMYMATIAINKRDRARREYENEIELAAHKTYADCRRAPRVDVRA